jgi:hypothetical protein
MRGEQKDDTEGDGGRGALRRCKRAPPQRQLAEHAPCGERERGRRVCQGGRGCKMMKSARPAPFLVGSGTQRRGSAISPLKRTRVFCSLTHLGPGGPSVREASGAFLLVSLARWRLLAAAGGSRTTGFCGLGDGLQVPLCGAARRKGAAERAPRRPSSHNSS